MPKSSNSSLTCPELLAIINSHNKALKELLNTQDLDKANEIHTSLRKLFQECIDLGEKEIMPHRDSFLSAVSDFEQIKTQYEAELAELKKTIIKMKKDKTALKKYTSL